jgi:hypothetical protein
MILRLNGNTRIDNLRNHPAEVIEKLRGLLAGGAHAYPDPHRKNFYDVENGSRWFYIHMAPTGNVWLLGTWLKQREETPATSPALVAARP